VKIAQEFWGIFRSTNKKETRSGEGGRRRNERIDERNQLDTGNAVQASVDSKTGVEEKKIAGGRKKEDWGKGSRFGNRGKDILPLDEIMGRLADSSPSLKKGKQKGRERLRSGE